MAQRNFSDRQSLERQIKSLYFKVTYAPTAAKLTLPTTTPIVLTKVALNSLQNSNTYRLVIAAAAANPTDTVLAIWTGTTAATVLTITPNNGTNNAATPVDLTTAEVVELINTGVVVGKTVTVTDAGTLRNKSTAIGGGAEVVVHAGEGDLTAKTFSGALDFTYDNSYGISSVALTAAGTIRVILEDRFVDLKWFDPTMLDGTARDFTYQIKAYDVNAATAYIDFYTLTTGTATTIPVNSKLMAELIVKNTTVI